MHLSCFVSLLVTEPHAPYDPSESGELSLPVEVGIHLVTFAKPDAPCSLLGWCVSAHLRGLDDLV